MDSRDVAIVTRLTAEFPTMPAETVLRQVDEAGESLRLFGVADDDRDALVERLARAHLEALRDVQSPEDRGPGRS